MGPSLWFPALSLGPLWKLLWLEGYLRWSESLLSYESSQAGLQGRFDVGGCSGFVPQGHE
jgi:hypothetical protein